MLELKTFFFDFERIPRNPVLPRSGRIRISGRDLLV